MRRGMRFDTVRLLVTASAMVGMLLVAACDGENLFSPVGQGPGGGGADTVGDTIPPNVTLIRPQPDAQNAKPLGDSILIEVNVSDSTALDRVVFGGIAKRGDPSLGTDEVVTRFQSKVVSFGGTVRDTTGLRRYLLPAPDTTRETAFVFVEAFDTAGNRSTDTVQVILGGPDVQVLNLADSQTRAAGRLNLSVVARDPNGIEQIRITTDGQYESELILPVTPVEDSVALDTAVVIPPGITGLVNLSVTARSALGVLGQAGPFRLTIVSGEPVDTTAPQVAQTVIAGDRLELTDSIEIQVEGSDNSEGTGIASLGVTLRGFSELGGDTLVETRTVDFPQGQSGVTERTFRLAPFNVDPIALPERLIYQVVSFAVDASGNCAVTSSDEPAASSPCAALPSGETFVVGGGGQVVSTSIVSGRTVRLPDGGSIRDAAVDTVRRDLYLANFGRNQVEHFDMEAEEFRPPVRIGSQPWGLSMNTCFEASPSAGCGDTLIVGNSGGTNFDFVELGASPRYSGRLLTRDVVAFNFTLQESGETGVSEWVIDPLNIFSDRPQFVALDASRRIHFSTQPTEVGSERGTIRKIFLPNGDPNLQPEVQMHNLAPSGNAEDSYGLLHADDVDPAPGRSAVFNVVDREEGTSNVVRIANVVDETLSPTEIMAQLQSDIDASGSDARIFSNPFVAGDLAFGDTTFVAASGNGKYVAFGESGEASSARIIMYESDVDVITAGIPVADLIINRSDRVQGLSLNYDGTLGVARGENAYFFTPDLRLQGVVPIAPGGAGAVLHPLHANGVTIDNPSGGRQADTHLAFVASGDRTIDIYDTFHFFQLGDISIRDVITGPLRASLPFPGDNEGLTCPATTEVVDANGVTVGQALEIFIDPGVPNPEPWPVDGGAGGNEDRCIILKLYGVTDTGGVLVLDVRKSDILRRHPSRLN